MKHIYGSYNHFEGTKKGQNTTCKIATDKQVKTIYLKTCIAQQIVEYQENNCLCTKFATLKYQPKTLQYKNSIH